MVRRKDDAPLKNVKVTKKPVVVQKTETTRIEKSEPTKVSRLRLRRKSSSTRILGVVGFVALLLVLGWFATTSLLANGGNNLLAGLFSGGTPLAGESEGRVNMLLLGQPGDPKHDGPYLTDTIIFASYDTKEKFLHMVSLPRDLWVNVPGYGMSRINAAYQLGVAQGKDGAEVSVATVEQLLGVDIPYYSRIDFAGFEQIVDELGGITVDVKKDLYDPYYPDKNHGYETLEIKAGVHTMDGATALKYVRSRKTTSDFDRARRQQEVLLAIRDKARSSDLLTTPGKLLEIQSIIKAHFSTNLSPAEMQRIIEIANEVETGKVDNKVIDDASTKLLYATNVDGAFVLKPIGDDYNKLKEFITATLAQTTAATVTETPKETEAPLNIEVLNGTAVTGLAGTKAEELKKGGYVIKRTGNNATKGVQETIVYDGTGGKRLAAVKQLADILGAKISTETVALGTGIDARVVLGENAKP